MGSRQLPPLIDTGDHFFSPFFSSLWLEAIGTRPAISWVEGWVVISPILAWVLHFALCRYNFIYRNINVSLSSVKDLLIRESGSWLVVDRARASPFCTTWWKNTGCFPSNSEMPQLAFVPTSVSAYVRDPIYGHGHQWNYQLTPFDCIVHVW